MDWASFAALVGTIGGLITAAGGVAVALWGTYYKGQRDKYSLLFDRLQADVVADRKETKELQDAHANCREETARLREKIAHFESQVSELRADYQSRLVEMLGTVVAKLDQQNLILVEQKEAFKTHNEEIKRAVQDVIQKKAP